jgi:hypothetical protein
MCRIVLPVQESGQAKYPIAVSASGISAEGECQQLEHRFLPPKGEASFASLP